jgi:hypothetical protein
MNYRCYVYRTARPADLPGPAEYAELRGNPVVRKRPDATKTAGEQLPQVHDCCRWYCECYLLHGLSLSLLLRAASRFPN